MKVKTFSVERTYRRLAVYFSPETQRAIPWLLIGLGALLRCAQYAYNRSFWIDECFLGLASADRSFAELLEPLPLNQAAPIGYLYLQKVVVGLLGPSDYTLRLLPLAAGLVSLPLFARVARRYVDGVPYWCALSLFALSDFLIYYSSEAKQYSGDVAVTLCCYLLAEQMGEALSIRKVAWVGLSGAALAWLSHPAIFVLTALAIAYGAPLAFRREWRLLGGHLLVFAAWGISFAVLYHAHLSRASNNPFLNRYWAFAYVPAEGFPIAQTLWLLRMSGPMFQMLSIAWDPAPAMIAAVGVVLLWRRSPVLCSTLVLPLLLTLTAAALHKYPFSGRLILFLAPVLILILCTTIDEITRRNVVLGVLVSLLILAQPAQRAFYHLLRPREHGDVRSAVTHLLRLGRPDDAVFASWSAQFPLDHYCRLAGRRLKHYARGVPLEEGAERFLGPIQSLRGAPRVWVLLAPVLDWDPTVKREANPEEAVALNYLNRVGIQLDAFRVEGASVYLYDLSRAPHGAGETPESHPPGPGGDPSGRRADPRGPVPNPSTG